MRTNRIPALWALLLTSGLLVFGVTACGSSDSNGDSDSKQTTEVSSDPDPTGAEKKNGGENGRKEVTPNRKAPQSAGDKNGNAPDDVVSDRPGGPANPNPSSP